MNKYHHIPEITDLIVAGNPLMKIEAEHSYSVPSHIDELNMRIEELESAIGQDTSGPIGRAYAIRAEASCDKDSDATIGHLFPKKELL